MKPLKRSQSRIILALLACLCLFVAACSPGGTSAASGTPASGNATATTAQPTAKATLTALPPITQALCQQLMTVA
ncbi:MAG TPA: hypothetical protein VJO13_09440, partial [Ktedonobacterales bacterium]|nr:hypothetical protein [Ktedonobacterales bacterium]